MIDIQNSSRRKFIKTFVAATTYSTFAGGAKMIGNLLGEITASASPTDGFLKVNINDFEGVLNSVGGSVRLGVCPISGNTEVQPANADFYPFMINRDEGDVFHVLSTRCQHEASVVNKYSGSNCRCPNHGSLYRIDGTYIPFTGTFDAPVAQRDPLERLESEFDGADTLTVCIPNLGYEITGSVVNASSNLRYQIHFSDAQSLIYEVLFRQNVRDDWTPVKFSTQENGEANLMQITGRGRGLTLYVDQMFERGFYAVNTRVNEI